MPLGDLTVSKFRFYSAGIVAENKKLSSKEIEATPIEEIPFTNGEISGNVEETKAKAKNAGGGSYESSVKSTVTIKAQWLSLGGSNRLTAPDVRRGEMVMLYQFGDTDKYYWVTMKEDISLRKLETVIFGFSGTTAEGAAPDDSCTYYLEISTHKKVVHFHTSKANGEAFGYDIQLNTGEGYLVIQDDVGNLISLNSAEQRIELKNLAGAHYDMQGANLTIDIPGTTTHKTGSYVIECSGDYSVNAGGGATITSSATVIN